MTGTVMRDVLPVTTLMTLVTKKTTTSRMLKNYCRIHSLV